MYECPNCAGNLKFDIARQKLFCEYCGTQVDPYDYEKKRDAEEAESSSEEYDVTVFTCPQCGGQILSEDTTAVTFCSFCGASTILDSRISRERRPEYILPFTRTKEDCRAAFFPAEPVSYHHTGKNPVDSSCSGGSLHGYFQWAALPYPGQGIRGR